MLLYFTLENNLYHYRSLTAIRKSFYANTMIFNVT